MSSTQRKVLEYMARMNTSTVFCDPLQKWLWKDDFRQSPELAETYYQFKKADIETA